MLLRDEKPILVLPLSWLESCKGIIHQWKQQVVDAKNAAGINEQDMKMSSFLVLGINNPFIGRLYGKMDDGEAALSV